MAIPNIAKSFKLPRRLRWKTNTDATTPPPETTVSPRISSDKEITTNRATKKEEQFRQVFQFLDTNNDGGISVEELRDYFTSAGEPMSDEEAEKIIREFSKVRAEAGDSLLLEFEEFVRMMGVRDGEDDMDQVLRQVFEVYEVEKGSGCITPEGVRQVLSRLGVVKSRQECEAMIRAFDHDGNGVLDFHEFQKMMT